MTITKQELREDLGKIIDLENVDIDNLFHFIQDRVETGQVEDNKTAILNFLSMIL